jgi:hypothetical protein
MMSERLPEPRLTKIFRLEASLGEPLEVGNVALARRRIVPLTGGTFAGPELNGTLLPGVSADWLGTQYFLDDQPKTLAAIRAALREAGLPEYLAEAGNTDTYDPILRRSHREGINLVGQEVGSPIIAIPAPGACSGKIAFFGPVVNPTPTGEQAALLWSSLLSIASIPGFYEIKRTRTCGPILN